MNKKYTIVNNALNGSSLCIDNLFYILILILALYLIIQLVSMNYKDEFNNYKENFDNNTNNTVQNNNSAITQTAQSSPATSSSAQNIANTISSVSTTTEENQKLTLEQELQEAKTLANALKVTKETLEENMQKQARALFLAKNYYKVDDSSFNNQLTFINDDFDDIRLPESDFKGKILVSTPAQWKDILTRAGSYKNLYKPGDVVIKPSNYNISKDTICYKDYETHLANDSNFKKKYPECMVCSVNPDEDYKNTKSWKNTQTNIHKVCLFNPNAPNDSTVLNYNGCKNLCNLKN
jgi:hypothetical protein